MPSPRRKHSPSYDGKPRHLISFLRDYEVAADAAQLQDADRVNRVLEYVKPTISDSWSRFASYKDANKTWNTFKLEVPKYNPEATLEQRYSLKDLRKLIKKNSKKSIKPLSDLASYYRKFGAIPSWLTDKNHIAEMESNQMFLEGFRSKFRRDIGSRLQITHPNHDPNTPHNCNTVYDAAIYLLKQKGRYKAKSGHRESKESDGSGSDSSDSDDSDDSGSDSDDSGSDSDSKSRKKRSSNLPTTSPSPSPAVQIKQEQPTAIPIAFERVMQQMLQNQTNALTAAIAAAASNVLSGAKAPPVVVNPVPTSTAGARYTGCAFCDLEGHFISQCPTADEYIKSGKAARDTGKSSLILVVLFPEALRVNL